MNYKKYHTIRASRLGLILQGNTKHDDIKDIALQSQ